MTTKWDYFEMILSLSTPAEMEVKYDPRELPLNESIAFRFPFSFAERWRYKWVRDNVTPWLSQQTGFTQTEKVNLIHYYLTTNNQEIVGNNIVETHGDIPGKFRKHDPIFINLIGDQLIYVCPDSMQLDTLMYKVEKVYEQMNKHDPIMAEAWQYLMILGIHPYSNVNGRVSRLMMDVGLLENGYHALPWESDRLFMTTVRLLKQRFFSTIALRVNSELDTKHSNSRNWSTTTGNILGEIIDNGILTEEVTEIVNIMSKNLILEQQTI